MADLPPATNELPHDRTGERTGLRPGERSGGHSAGHADDPAPVAESGELVQVAFNLPLSTFFTYEVPEGARCSFGSRVIAPFGRRTLTGFVVETRALRPDHLPEIKTFSRVLDAEPLFDRALFDLARWMSNLYLSSLGECLGAIVPGARREVQLPALGADEAAFSSVKYTLSDEQEHAIETIASRPDGRTYVYGITGSGKTEVFLHAASRTLDEGRSVIYLVPEIALTHQMVETIRARFGALGAVLHSGLTASQRLAEWRRIQAGDARFVIGARSAGFAPVRNLGLIVVDEEHEGSYKSSASPRYHARQIAMKRCADAGARLVMGSATPSVEAYELARAGKIVRVDLTRRLSGGSMPETQIVDIRNEETVLSRALVQAMRETHAQGRQSILFLNRRGFAHFFHCRSCGYEMKCRRCSVGMTYHKNRGLMICHYCGYRARPEDRCPECGSLDVGYGGFGTQKIEEEIRETFPDYRVRRLDTDSVKKRGALEAVIREFRDGEIDVLLGTQMVAKGLNFPGVKLVGIVLADTGLHMPDFRAAERTFNLIVQVAGRAGRFMPDGKVIIQTLHPDNAAIRLAASGDLERYYDREIDARKMLRFPPFARLIRVVFRGRSDSHVSETAARFAAEVSRRIGESGEILGPAECPIGVIARNHRYQLIIRSVAFDRSHRALASSLAAFRAPRDVYLEIDVDPVGLL